MGAGLGFTTQREPRLQKNWGDLRRAFLNSPVPAIKYRLVYKEDEQRIEKIIDDILRPSTRKKLTITVIITIITA
jgi:hypothetical protein